MSWHIVITVLCLSVIPMLPLPEAIAAPGSTMTNPWQPVARIEPTKPFQVQIINKTGIELEYSSTTNEFSPRKLAPSAITTVKQLPTPVYLLINPLDGRLSLKYTVSTRNNLVTVIVTQSSESRTGYSTINIQETGGIFAY